MPQVDRIRLRELHELEWSGAWVWSGTVAAVVAIEAAIIWTLREDQFWLALPLTLLVAHFIHSNLIAFHETAHRTLSPIKWVNDAIGLSIGVLSFMSLTLYRVAHKTHHRYLATVKDEELWPFVDPEKPLWLRRLFAALELSVGVIITPLLFLRTFLRPGTPVSDSSTRARIWIELGAITLFWLGVFAGATYFRFWNEFVLTYVLPAVFAGNMQSFRKYTEHMGLLGTTPLASTRSVVPSGWYGRQFSRSVFNIPLHGVHHIFQSLPQSNMPRLTQILRPPNRKDSGLFSSYTAAGLDMVRSLGNPRIGAQWTEHAPDNRRRKDLRGEIEGKDQIGMTTGQLP